MRFGGVYGRLLFCYAGEVIYLFYGSDVERVRAAAFAWVAAARAKQPDLAYVRLSREELSPAALEDAALSGGLFIKRLLVLLDDPFADDASLIEERLEVLAKSDNAIVILAPKLAAAKAKKIIAKATKTYQFDAQGLSERGGGFNSGLVNALAVGSCEKLWLEVVRALRAGDAPEMLHGLLHWKARDLIAKGRPGARDLSLNLIALLQTSRRTGVDLSESLERFALSI